MITDIEVKQMAITDLIANLKKCKNLAKVAGFGWEVDDDLSTLIEQSEHALDDL